MSERPDECDGAPNGDAELSKSFRLTDVFLRRHPRYREVLSLTPEHHRFDPVLWRSSVAALRGLLANLAEEEGITPSDEVLDRAVANLIEGIVKLSQQWPPEEPGQGQG